MTNRDLKELRQHRLPDGRTLYEVTQTPVKVGIVQTDESDVGLVWAIYLAEFQDHWLNAYKSLESAQKACQKIGWQVVEIFASREKS